MKKFSEYDLYSLSGADTVDSVQEARVLPWIAARGDTTRRLDYKLNRKSIVYDVGGYIGEWAGAINDMFGCHIEIFEPVSAYVALLKKKFAKDENITVHGFGLGDKTEKIQISLENEASSTFKKVSNSELVQIEQASKHIYHEHIDLMKINIEGGEFGLLNDLIKTGNIQKIENLQIQFHDFAPNAANERRRLHKLLANTHVMTFNYPWVWESWRRRDD